ncbi:hypothetical protein [Companilactobacillus sp. DQM5]|uniref:hypothetical protein n=1 Tax=Companilactobacillus sp. DQM5 TaxID=3463359 RepID=UPI00405846B2
MRKATIFVITAFSIILGIMSFSKKIDAETLDIKGLTRNEFFDSSGMSHGKYHDRYDLGKVMKKGSQIKISASQKGTLNLLNDDNNTEKEYKIGPEEQTIIADYDSVPFVETPIDGTNIKVNYEFSGDTQNLAIFNSGDNQKEFLDNWEKSKSSFALFKGKNFNYFYR